MARRSGQAGRAAAILALAATPGLLQAQGDVELAGRIHGGALPPAGFYELVRRTPDAFEFSPDNGWIRRGRAVAAARRAQRAALVSPTAGPQLARMQNGVMTGDLRMPVFLVLYANTDSAALAAVASRPTMETRLFAAPPAPPYSVHTYYREISNDALSVYGTVLEWTRVPGTDVVYEGVPGCNGLCGTSGVGALIRDIVQLHDPTLDFSQFDNDGPDNVPNSGDDDGYVDAIVVLHPEVDGSCKNVNPSAQNSIWAHRWIYRGWTGSDLVTNDPSATPGWGNVRIRDYIIQGGQGGDGGCASNAPQAMGLVAHEAGHLLGLPDLYDTSDQSEGIGHWGLMGAGNWRVPTRPAYMEAWSRGELGWVTEVPLTRDTSIAIPPVETADSVFVVPIPGTNEYYLLENRQPIGSDGDIHGPGLLIWHPDSVLIRVRRGANSVNAQLPQGLKLVQADGLDQLGAHQNRGDAGDPFPGTTAKLAFRHNTNPSARTKTGAVAPVVIDSIRQVNPSGPVALRLRLGYPLTLTTTGPGTVAANPAAALVADAVSPAASTVTLVAAPNAGAVLDGWSGDTTTTRDTLRVVMHRPWAVTATFATALAVTAPLPPPAVMGASYQVTLTATGGTGSFTWSLASGRLPAGVTVRQGGLVAGVPEEIGAFAATVRVRSGNQTQDTPLTILVSAPHLVATQVVGHLVGPAARQTLTVDELRYLDLIGNRNGSFDVGDFLAFVQTTGGAVSADVMAAVLRRGAER